MTTKLRAHDVRGFCEVCGVPVLYCAPQEGTGTMQAREDTSKMRCPKHRSGGYVHRSLYEELHSVLPAQLFKGCGRGAKDPRS